VPNTGAGQLIRKPCFNADGITYSMNQTPSEYKILVIDLEVEKQQEPKHIEQCGAILFDLHNRKELEKLDTTDFGYVLPKRVVEDKSGLILKPTKSLTQEELFNKLIPLITQADVLVFHNAHFDTENLQELFDEYAGAEELVHFEALPKFCTMMELRRAIGLDDRCGKPKKWPQLTEAVEHYLPDETFKFHEGYDDAKATLAVFLAAFDKDDIHLV
jgi:hypothetical protein